MSHGNRKLWVIVAVLTGAAGMMSARAQLPSLNDDGFLGYFVGFENKRYQFGITAQGRSTLKVIGKKGEPLTDKLTVAVEFLVEEILPEGKTYVRFIVPTSLESAQPATDKPKNIVFRGKVKGDAAFEVSMNEDRGVVSLGGRLLDPGTLTKNPLRFSIRMKFPDAYPYEKKGGDKKQQKAFEEKSKGDRLQLMWTDGKKVKQATSISVDAGSNDLNGPGIAAAEIEFSSYQENKIQVTASENSVMKLSNSPAGALQEGFFLTWIADPAKDPEGKARLSLEVK